uniref:Pentatricopeptide repeat-containing protein At2g40720 n=1 Tax=Rhizophora mucronata TaxID=61149 RepID=A0A2P2PIQ1_RHIMU
MKGLTMAEKRKGSAGLEERREVVLARSKMIVSFSVQLQGFYVLSSSHQGFNLGADHRYCSISSSQLQLLLLLLRCNCNCSVSEAAGRMCVTLI